MSKSRLAFPHVVSHYHQSSYDRPINMCYDASSFGCIAEPNARCLSASSSPYHTHKKDQTDQVNTNKGAKRIRSPLSSS
jgi:hypothetical protein